MSVPSVELVQRACDYIARQHREKGGAFVQFLYDAVKVIDVADSQGVRTVLFRVKTVHEMRNSANMVHGGASCTIAAALSQLALAADSKYWASADSPTADELARFASGIGTTRSLDVQIIQAVPLDAEFTVQCRVLSSTKSNAFVTVDFLSPTGRVLVSAVHDIMKQRHPASLPVTEPDVLISSYHPSSRL